MRWSHARWVVAEPVVNLLARRYRPDEVLVGPAMCEDDFALALVEAPVSILVEPSSPDPADPFTAIRACRVGSPVGDLGLESDDRWLIRRHVMLPVELDPTLLDNQRLIVRSLDIRSYPDLSICGVVTRPRRLIPPMPRHDEAVAVLDARAFVVV